MNVIRFDRRATHRIFSEPIALDLVNDLDALLQESAHFLEAIHWVALGTGDEQLVRGIAAVHSRLLKMRGLSHEAAGLIQHSFPIDPYAAVQCAAVEAA